MNKKPSDVSEIEASIRMLEENKAAIIKAADDKAQSRTGRGGKEVTR